MVKKMLYCLKSLLLAASVTLIFAACSVQSPLSSEQTARDVPMYSNADDNASIAPEIGAKSFEDDYIDVDE